MRNQWEEWARNDPYFAVLSSDSYRRDTIQAEHREAFFQSGHQHIAEVLATAEQVFGPVRRGIALDYGCGVGRLLVPLAREFDRVWGLDVAPSMLREAGQTCARLENVRLGLASGEAVGDAKFDLVHSCLVFQHIPRRQGLVILEKLVGQLAPGGVGAIELPYARPGLEWRNGITRLRHRVRPVQVVLNLLQGRRWRDPAILMNTYPIGRLLLILQNAGIRRVHVLLRPGGQFRAAFLFFQRDA